MNTFITVGALAEHNNKYLVLQRASHRTNPGNWNCVTGHIKDRESAEQAALRELKEETNLEGTIIKTTNPFWVDSKDTRWVVVLSLIKVADISKLKIDPEEAQAYKWITLDDDVIKEGSDLQVLLKSLNLI